jgi:hypothetical protein
VQSNNAWFAIAKTAREIEADELLLGWSGRISADDQFQQMAIMWALVSDTREKSLIVHIISSEGIEMSAEL